MAQASLPACIARESNTKRKDAQDDPNDDSREGTLGRRPGRGVHQRVREGAIHGPRNAAVVALAVLGVEETLSGSAHKIIKRVSPPATIFLAMHVDFIDKGLD